jgi:predicted AlkP superfamily phosphohydrolase/phosphomutase
MDGAIAVNEWLIQNGYLALKHYPTQPTRFEELDVDWSRTCAWGEGGYYGRVFLNVEGREPQGTVPPSRYSQIRKQIKEQLELLGDSEGRPIGTRVVISDEAYKQTKNIAPDLSVFFGDLYWRSSGMVGSGRIHARENDTGPDGANHNWDGIFIMAEGKDLRTAKVWNSSVARDGLRIFDVAPTLLDTFGVRPFPEMQGRVVALNKAHVA